MKLCRKQSVLLRSFLCQYLIQSNINFTVKLKPAPTGSASSSTRASPANTVRGGSATARPAASNISLDDITSQLEKASLSMDEAARQTSSSSSSSSSFSSSTIRRPSSGSSGGGGQHRRTGSVGAVTEQDAPSQRSSVNSACASASSMDSLDTDKVTGGEVESQGSPISQGQNQTNTEVRATLKHTHRRIRRFKWVFPDVTVSVMYTRTVVSSVCKSGEVRKY